MDRNYWDTIARDYDGEIFDVRASDKNRVIEKRISRLASGRDKAIDFGCGTGKFLPFLSRYFPGVQGYDLSAKLVKQAVKAYRELANVRVDAEDLAYPQKAIPRGDFGLCVNVLITDSYAVRSGILKTISRSLKKDSPLLLVVPSLESALLTSYRLIDWNLRDGDSYRKAAVGRGIFQRVEEGVVDIDSVPTKHYLREELEDMLPKFGFRVKALHKVEYDWNTEFEKPPGKMKAPYPWDWLLEAVKT
jgi:SAM-dependent methyltransferase